MQVFKYANQHFFLNKAFIQNKDNESGKLVFQLTNYNIPKSKNNELAEGVEHQLMTINEEVQLIKGSSSLISIVQNGKDLYYFKIAKENQYDIFNLCIYDMVTKKESVVKSQKLNPKFDSKDEEEMDAISVLIVQTDDFYSSQQVYDEEIDYVRFK